MRRGLRSGIGWVFLVVAVSCLMAFGIANPMGSSADATARAFTDAERHELVSLAESATVRLSSRTCNGLMRGSGFVTEIGLLTNHHLVAGATEVKVDRATSPMFLPIMAASPELDIALVAPIPATTLELASGLASHGDPVILAGHPGGTDFGWIETTVGHYDVGSAWGIGGEVLILEGETVAGFSGGPVLNRDGEVIAVLHGFDPITKLTIAIPAADIETWVANTVEPDVSGTAVQC